MAAKFNIQPHIIDILQRSTRYIPDKPSPANLYTLKLPDQLERKDYMAVMKVIEGAGGKWDKKKGLHSFREDPTEVLGLAITTGKGRNIQQEFQAFYTPSPLADKLAALLPKGVKRVLEPSCGEGALVRAVRKLHPEAFMVGVDINPTALQKCGLSGQHLGPETPSALGWGRSVLKDVLHINPDFGDRFDGVCMNPPFTGGQDAEHVRHAMEFLLPGGTLVALMTPNAMQKATGKYKVLTAELEKTARWEVTHSEIIPAKTFADTPIETLLIRIERVS